MAKIKTSKLCIYCKEQKIHPAFAKDHLCGTCASDCFEDYQKRVAIWQNSKDAVVTNVVKVLV